MMLNLLDKYRATMAPDGPDGGGGSSSPSPSAPSTPSGATSPASPGSGSITTSSPPSSPAAPTPSQPSGPAKPDVKAPAGESFDFGSMFEEPITDPAAALAAGAPPAAKPTGADALGPPQDQPPSATARADGTQPAPDAKPAPVDPAAAKAAPDGSTPPATQPASQFIDPYNPVALAQHLGQNEAQALEFVSRTFQLSPEEREALEQDVTTAIPRLMAKVFVKSQQNVLMQLGRMIPMMMQRHLEANTRNSTNEDRFYSRWPDIKRDQHHANVQRYAAVYRQMHPQATLEQMIEDLGPMIMMVSKIVPSAGAPAASPGRPAGPAPNPMGANGRSPPPSPFVPAGAGPTSASKAAELSPWEAMFTQPDS